MIAVPGRQGSTAVLVPRQLASGGSQWQALHLSVHRTGKPSPATGRTPGTSRQAVPLATPFVAAAAAFVVGRISARRKRGAEPPAPVEEHDPWLDNIAVSTRIAAVVHAFTASGLIEALPRPGEPFVAAAELAKRAGIKGGGGELERLLRLLACHEILEVDQEEGAAFRHSKRSLELLPGGKDHTFAMVHLSPAHVRPWWRVGEALQASEEEVPEPVKLELAAILAEEGFAMGRVEEGRDGGVAEPEVLPPPQEAQAPEADLLELEKPAVAAEPLPVAKEEPLPIEEPFPVEESLPEEQLVEEEVPAKEPIAEEKALKEELPAPLLQEVPEKLPVPSEAEGKEKPKRSQGDELKDWLMA